MQIPYDDPLATSTRALSTVVTPVSAPHSPGVSHRSAAPKPAAAVAAPERARNRPAAAKPAAPAKTDRARSVPVAGSTTSTKLALPPLGGYPYALSGFSSVGPPPATMRLTVAEGSGPGAELWTMDARRSDGSGVVEEFTLARGPDGIYLRTYRLDASTGSAGLILDFVPTAPVLFEPDHAETGHSSEFEMTSTDGCTRARTTVTMVSAGDRNTVRHLSMDSTLRTIGPVSCIAVSGERVEDLYHSGSDVLPTQIDSELHGTLAGIPVRATSHAVATRGASDVARSAFE